MRAECVTSNVSPDRPKPTKTRPVNRWELIHRTFDTFSDLLSTSPIIGLSILHPHPAVLRICRLFWPFPQNFFILDQPQKSLFVLINSLPDSGLTRKTLQEPNQNPSILPHSLFSAVSLHQTPVLTPFPRPLLVFGTSLQIISSLKAITDSIIKRNGSVDEILKR
jgi:hypothetical protein